MTDIKMTMTQQVDVTPDQVRAALSAWKDSNREILFPHAPGEFVRLTPELAAALGVHADAPVLVLGRAEGSSLGTCALVGGNGAITAMSLQSGQVRAEVASE